MKRYIITGALTPTLWTASKSKNTKYRVQKTVAFADGTSKRLTAYGATKAACIDNLHTKAQDLAESIVTADTMTFRDAAVRWLSDKKRSGRKYGTIHSYSEMLNGHLLPVLGDTPLHAITFEQLEQLLFHMCDKGIYRSAEICRMIVDGVFKWAKRYYRNTYQLDNPIDYLQPLPRPRKTPNSPKRTEKFWTDDQLQAFLNASKHLYDQRRSLLYPLYVLAVSSGMRRSELLGLSWDNVHSQNGKTWVSVVEQYVTYDKSFIETPKTEHGTRDIPISVDVYEVLIQHRHIILTEYAKAPNWQHNNLVLPSERGTHIRERTLRRSLDKLIQRLSLPRITMHDFRRIYASNLVNLVHQQGDFPVKILQARLGHARSDVSMEIYVKMLQSERPDVTFTVLADDFEKS